MTPKRFVDYFDKDHNYIIQDLQNEDEYQVGFANCDEDVFLELINQLSDENEQLRKEKIDAEVKLYSANEKILMQMDYDEIIKQNTENEIEITNLKKENERLRRCINTIYTIARLEEV